MADWFFNTHTQAYYREKDFFESENVEYSHFEVFDGANFHECVAFASKKNLFYIESSFGEFKLHLKNIQFQDSLNQFKGIFGGKAVNPDVVKAMFNFLDVESKKFH